MGSGSAGKVKPPPVPAPAPTPAENDVAYEQAKDDERRRRRRAAGYAKTLLSKDWTLGAGDNGGKTLLG